MNIAKSIIWLITDLLFPRTCISCGKTLDKNVICDRCFLRLEVLPWVYCIRCGKRLLERTPCPHHKYRTPIAGLGIALDYNNETVRRLVWHYKYRGKRSLADVFGDTLNRYAEHALIPLTERSAALVVPVPLHRKRELSRGFNQAALIAQKFADHFGFDYRDDVLVRNRPTKSQVTLGTAQARLENVRGAFYAPDPNALKNRTIVLVDDVVSTGATLEEAARTLRQAGAKIVWGLTLARSL